jgi:hypothetical protein
LQLDLLKLEKLINELGDVLLIEIEMAARLDVTVIANTHVSEAAGGSANSRVIGSVAFVNHARAAFIVTADPADKDRRLFIPSKTNLGRPREGLAYRIADTTIVGADGELICAPYVKWEDATVTMSTDEAVAAMAGGIDGKTAKSEAIEFLLDELAEGPKPAAEVSKAATAAGHTPKAIRMAREALGIKPRKTAGKVAGAWVWGLPEGGCPQDAYTKKWASWAPLEKPKDAQAPLNKDEDAQDAQDAQSSGGAPSSDGEGNLDNGPPTTDTAEGFPDLPAFLDRRRHKAL